MRVLFSATAGDGHYYPVMPLARALREQGHDVAFAMSSEYAERLSAAGFTWFASGVDTAELMARLMPRLAGLPPQESPEYMPFVISQRYAVGDAPDRLADLMQITSTWRPDLIVFEPCDLAAPIAAAALGVPAVNHSFGRVIAAQCYERSAPHVLPLWQQAGFDMPPLCGMYEGPYVDLCPPSLQRDGVPAAAIVLPLRGSAPTSESPPDWLKQLPDRPSVYVTLGTIFNDVPRLRLLLDALAEQDLNVVMTIGRDRNPEDLTPCPANAVVRQFVPQDLLLPHMQAMVTHAGSGSMLAALAHGVPMVMLPRGADQLENAEACRDLGISIVLRPEELTADRVRADLTTIMSEAAYVHNATAVAKEISAMPDAVSVAQSISREFG